MDDDQRFAGLTVWAVRIVGLGIAVLLLWWSERLLFEFLYRGASKYAYDWGQFWLIQAVYVVAGMAFAVAVSFPFPRSRYAWGRLLIAGIVILPVVHFWFAFMGTWTGGPEFFHRGYWFDEVNFAVWSILAGVAIGAGFGARRPAE